MTKSNNLLVVGGTGFIGNQLVCEAVGKIFGCLGMHPEKFE